MDAGGSKAVWDKVNDDTSDKGEKGDQKETTEVYGEIAKVEAVFVGAELELYEAQYETLKGLVEEADKLLEGK